MKTCFSAIPFIGFIFMMILSSYNNILNAQIATNVTQSINYSTIQEAIDAANPGDDISLSADIFEESVVVSEEVEIYGAGQGMTVVIPGCSDPMGGSLACPVFLIRANNVIIRNLTIDGKNDAVNGSGNIDASTGIITDWATGDYTNLEVHHITVQDVYLRGLQATNSVSNLNTFNFHDNNIDGVEGNAGSSIAILNYGDAGTIDENIITNSANGIVTNSGFGTVISNNNITLGAAGSAIESDNNGDGGGTGDDISNNTIIGGANGILIYNPYYTVDIIGNNISQSTDYGIVLVKDNIAATGTTNAGQNIIETTGTGLWVDDAASLNSATENFINNSTNDGIYIHPTAGTIGLINNNSFSMNGLLAINNESGFSINATCNWYGFEDAATVATQVSADVNYSPFLTSGVDIDLVTTGFQPEANTCNGCITGAMNSNTGITFCTIQQAIDAVGTLNNHTILVDAGSFYENVIVDKELNICGAGQDMTYVKPAISSPTANSLGSAVFLVKANNVIIHDLTIDGKNELITDPGDVDASTGIITDWVTGDWDALEVYNVTVKDVFYRGIQSTFLNSPNNFFDFYDNIIDGVQGDPSSIGIFNYGNYGIIENNTITNSTTGIYTNESFGTDIYGNDVTGFAGSIGIGSANNAATGGYEDFIENNVVTGGDYGIYIFQPGVDGLYIGSNTISNSINTGIIVQSGSVSVDVADNTVTNTSAAIGIDIDGSIVSLLNNNINTNATGVQIANNGLLAIAFQNFISTNASDGVRIESDGTVGAMFENDLSGNTGFAINNLSANEILASCNWYGTKDPTIIAGEINGSVLYTNWLTSGIDDDVIAPGFQSEFNSCNGNTIKNVRTNELYSLIEDAMDDPDFIEGDELEIPTCLYPGCVTIDKDVKLTATGGEVIFECIDMNGIAKNLILGSDFTFDMLNLTNGKIYTNGNRLSCGEINGGGPTNYIVTD